MREIKFRAWIAIPPSKNISYLHKNIEKEKSGYMSREFDFTSFDGDYFKPNGCNIMDMITMQYTGLKDKNDKEIYESDVIAIDGGGELYNFSVEFEDGCFGIRTNGKDFAELKYYIDMSFVKAEIIGNIYEDPELIK